jgi:hypothetical protein
MDDAAYEVDVFRPQSASLTEAQPDEGAEQDGKPDLFALVAGRFFRVEPRLRARAYVRGLLAPLASKNGWTLAEGFTGVSRLGSHFREP